MIQDVILVLVPLSLVILVSIQELILHIVTVQSEPSIMPIVLNMNVKSVLINVLPVKKNLKHV